MEAKKLEFRADQSVGVLINWERIVAAESSGPIHDDRRQCCGVLMRSSVLGTVWLIGNC
jgi:hypothetical protein